ncbi:P-loop containing nucleoside triphosphate hydrolase protein [Phlebopus sp. FC_14]|nr:P-loop containing nucleoside triphosphate hydrolase protein [Phlebopus sp. FC_14]
MSDSDNDSRANTHSDTYSDTSELPQSGVDKTSLAAKPTETPAVEQAAVLNTEEAGDHYLRRWLIWNSKEYDWVPYDPSSRKIMPPRTDLQNYFYVDVRYKRAKDKPKTILSNFSKPLISFLRTAIGGEFFNAEPAYPIRSSFLFIDDFKRRLEEAHSALDSPHALDQIRKAAHSLGCVDVDLHDNDYPLNYLTDLVEHLGALLRLMEEEYRPLAEQLALQVSHGRIAHDLLIFHFRPGQRIYTEDDEGLPIAFDVTSTRYTSVNHFSIGGKALSWDGTEYTSYKIEKRVDPYDGTTELTQLPWWAMTPEIEEGVADVTRPCLVFTIVHIKAGELLSTAKPITIAIPAIHVLFLLESIVYGFDLHRKQWSRFLVDEIEDVTFDENSWEHLVLEPDTKELVQSLTSATVNSNTSGKIISDVISGKGGGLIVVLHGPPGTGKTLTAEAVAEFLKRPLYTINSLELSTRPDELETKLTPILKLATAWDAVLLIDEADVFLEERSLHEVERNALVSVALRLFEYHRGVLFLTTNRIKTFDRAFLSRFSIAIKYPELDAPARFVVWKKFLELTVSAAEDQKSGRDTPNSFIEVVGEGNKEVASEADLHELSLKPFNGRTIKNIVRTAQALALSKREALSIEHVKKVVRVQEGFLNEFDHV